MHCASRPSTTSAPRESFARGARKQQEGFRALAAVGGDLQRLLLPFSYAQEGLKTVQRATQQVLEVTEESAQQGLRVAEEATEQTDKVLRKTEKVAREAELRTPSSAP